jgi:hypothetical protein
VTVAADVTGTLDRIVFVCTARGEMHTVGTSLSATELACWTEHLYPHVSADPSADPSVEHGDRPAVSMRYSSADGGAALLRRMRGQGGAGDQCHVLVGWHADLTPELALRMHSWVGWTGAAWIGPELRRLDLATWRPGDAPAQDLDRAATGQLANLTALVAAVLRDPRRPVSIVSGQAGLAERIALLWGLHAVVKDLLDVPGEPPYTFSTFETHQAGAGPMAVRVAFVPPDVCSGMPTSGPAAGAFPATRMIVRLPVADSYSAGHGGSYGDTYSHAARALVRCYVRGGVPAVREWQDRRHARMSHSVMDRVHRVIEMAEADPMFPLGSPGPRPGGSTVPAEGAAPSPAVSSHDIERALLGDADDDTVRRVLRTVTTQRAATGDTSRVQIRELVTRHRSWERRLRDTLSPAEARAAVDGLLRIAFEPGDLKHDEVVHDIQQLVATLDAASLVLSRLVALVVDYGEHPILLEAAGVRWLREHGYSVTPPARTPLGRPGGPQRESRWRSHLPTPLPRPGRTAAPRSRVAPREI